MRDTPWAPPGGTAAPTPSTTGRVESTLAVIERTPPSTRPQHDLDLSLGHDSDSASTTTGRDPRGLLHTGWLKVLWLVLQLAAIPLVIVEPVAGSAIAVLALVALMTWSAMAAVNADRARPETVYSRAPRPVVAALSWLASLAVLAAAAGVVWFLVEQTSVADDLRDDARRERIATIVAVVGALPFLLALYRPYSVLGRVAAWVGGPRRSWQYFFWLPVLASVLAALVQWIFLVTAGMDAEDGRLGFVGVSSVGMLLGLVALPTILTLWLGWTAMSDTERASRMTWERRNFPEGSLDLSDEFVARAAAAAYLSSHPEG